MPLGHEASIVISAGEFSGDLLAAELVHSLMREFPQFWIFGITGPNMESVGVHSIATTAELSVMGVVEVARKICEIKHLELRILTWIDRVKPKFAVLVDFPGFHFRLAEQLKMRGIPVFQYVAPKVWAWGKGRIPALQRDFTKVLGILPFEAEFFKEHQVPYEYVGSPHWDRVSKIEMTPADLGFPPDRPIIAFLPGSRMSEMARILPEMVKIRAELQKKLPHAMFVIPLAASIKWAEVSGILGNPVVENEGHGSGFKAAGFHWISGGSLELMKVARVAVLASGTATLECAIVGTPMVVLYVMNDFSYWLARRAVSVKWASLVNLLMNEEVVKEHLQFINPLMIAEEVFDLAQDSLGRRRMQVKFAELAQGLLPGAAATAARIIRTQLSS
ncbi:MAG: lipid-A-disaccharide synthase [Proteobacteria bacterium]|nr:lipid-A-disaccharide synthase [Pseudomonadota bacterium]